jgi:DEAD/DEAH box helicase domain-containing protein
VFGSHVANVIRRLKRICNHYGTEPQFILASATIANPAELAEKLIEAPVTVIARNGAPRGERQFIFYNPPVVNKALGIRRSSVLEASGLASELIRAGIHTIVFTRARTTAEVLLTYLRESLPKRVGAEETIRGYRGGYLPQQRREIEAGLRDGRIKGVVSTNALELGVDIGGLDAAVMTGYPGTVASTWQQAGRAGRRESVSVAFLVASSSPLDQFIIGHPDYFFEGTPESGLINPTICWCWSSTSSAPRSSCRSSLVTDLAGTIRRTRSTISLKQGSCTSLMTPGSGWLTPIRPKRSACGLRRAKTW